jgi:hypothetical protein
VPQQFYEKVTAFAANKLHDPPEKKGHLISVSESRVDQATKKPNHPVQSKVKMPIIVGMCCQSSHEWPNSRNSRSALCQSSFQGQDQREGDEPARQV